MKIYTKTGDHGETSLFGGGRVLKDSPRIEAYGTVDELNSCLGFVRSHQISDLAQQHLEQIQNDLFILGADLATPPDSKASIQRIESAHALRLEQWIDELDSHLDPLRFFILPGGTPGASALHIARTVCRRAERCLVSAKSTENISSESEVYLNRLSDYLFVLSRFENKQADVNETLWKTR